VAQELIAMGFKKVYTLKGGWIEWDEEGFPEERK